MADRFYKNVGVGKTESGYQILLDGRTLKTPGKNPLIFDRKDRAECVAQEWRAQDTQIRPETMPCTRLANVACEVTPGRRIELVEEYRKYCETDLLCYRSAHPKDLVRLQAEKWQPVIDWAAREHGIELAVTDGLEAIPQPEQSLKFAAQIAEKLTDIKLTLLLHFTASFGSAILALAVLEEHMDAEKAFRLSQLDEAFQNERWGVDEEAASRNVLLQSELKSLARLI